MSVRYLFLLAVVAACATADAAGARHALPPQQWPAASTNLHPPEKYADWWGDVQRCTGRQIATTIYEIEFVLVDALSLKTNNNRLAFGAWLPPHTIVLTQRKANIESVVKHEMVHFLTQSHEHGREFKDCDLPAGYAF